MSPSWRSACRGKNKASKANRLDGLLILLDDPSMPLHELKSAQRKLREITHTLQRIDDALAGQSSMLDSRRSALRRGEFEATAQWRGAQDLQALIGFQRNDIESLRQRLAEAKTRFARKVGEQHAVSLLEHQALPRAAADWQHIASGARHLPRLISETLAAYWQDFKFRTSETEFRRLLMACLVAPLVVVLLLWGSRHWRITAPGSKARRTSALTMNAFAEPKLLPSIPLSDGLLPT
jgi:hypothetical protein